MVFVQERKAKILAEKGAGVERDSIVDRDLLSILLRANMAVDMPVSLRMADEEVLERKLVSKFLHIRVLTSEPSCRHRHIHWRRT